MGEEHREDQGKLGVRGGHGARVGCVELALVHQVLKDELVLSPQRYFEVAHFLGLCLNHHPPGWNSPAHCIGLVVHQFSN